MGTITKAQYDIIQKEVNEATAAITGMAGATNAAAASTGKIKTSITGLGAAFDKSLNKFASFLKSNWVFIEYEII